ncbi:MAG: RNA-binding S4 domain-containing protein [candidate division NC10 bacterium]|nr:RNA-binding S4 domain-containing protein [candidate division NC10 bacterium]
MRLDVFLKESRLIKRRAWAKAACEAGRIMVGGAVAKAGREVRVGDRIQLDLGKRRLIVEVAALPRDNVSKHEASRLYVVLSEERIAGIYDEFD